LKDNITFLKRTFLNSIWHPLLLISALLLLFSGQACSSLQLHSNSQSQGTKQESIPQNLFNVSGQIINDSQIRSVQLYKNNNPDSPPIIELNSSDKLQLRFDYLDVSSKQFVVTFSHHTIDWSVSSLSPSDITQGIRRFYMDAGSVNDSSRPLYRSYTAEFPNNQVQFLKSGNYMMRVEDADTGYIVMAIPFFIFENEGMLESSVDFLQSPRQNLRSVHRPVNRYSIPRNIEQPQFNLAFRVVQNRFWGRAKSPDETDFSNPESVFFEFSQAQAFIADYYFYPLLADNLSLQNRRVTDYFPEEIPPRIVLRDDAENLPTFSNTSLPNSSYGLPEFSNNTNYVNIVFSFDAGEHTAPNRSVYLVGDFTGWSIQSEYRLDYEEETDRLQTSAIIKEGAYKYKYVMVENNRINDLLFDPLFERTKQEYQVFVYVQDKNEFYDRLLQVNTVVAES
jgi:hypothetical protein